MEPADPVLMLEQVRRTFGGPAAVEGVDLTVAAGEVLCLLGPSGCGKTTTLRMVAGLEEADDGAISIGGEIVDGGGTFVPPEARSVGLVFQDFALFPHLNVRDNVEFGISDQPQDARTRIAGDLLARVNLEAHAADFPHTLSGGEQQRVAMARALAPGPTVMLMDEPFSGLDFRLRDEVGEQTLSLLRELGTATLMVTHDSDEAMRLSDRVALMDRGRIVQQGTPGDLYDHPVNEFAAKFFSEINTLHGVVQGNSVVTPLGPVPAPGLADGALVTVCLRPESLALNGSGEDVAATVVSARNMGPYDLVWLNPAASQTKYLARLGPGSGPAAGTQVGVRISGAGCFVFPG